MSEFTTSTSLPTVCNYMPKQNIIEQEMLIFEQSFEQPDLLFSMAEEEASSVSSKKKAAGSVIDKTTFEIREEAIASMKATLLKTISMVCIHMIEHHREILKKQYKIAAEEMEAIQRKNA